MGYSAGAAVTHNRTRNMLEPEHWNSALSSITGPLVRGTERIKSADVLSVLGVGDDPAKRQAVGKRLVSAMRQVGWNGPKMMRFADGTAGSGYWRVPGALPVPLIEDHSELTDVLPAALEEVCRLSLQKIHGLLRLPLDPTNAGLLRAQVTASLGSIQAQLRADEQQLRRKTQGDVLQRLIKIIEEEKKALAAPLQQVEHVELERSDAEASATASGGDGSEEG
jgi:hypothetical protein